MVSCTICGPLTRVHSPQALELRDKDVESAIQLLGEVLEIRNNAYGEKALECADVYLYYGQLLFEQAQVGMVIVQASVRNAALQRACLAMENQFKV